MRRMLYGISIVLGLYYWLDSAVLAVGSPNFPELQPGSDSYRIAVFARSILLMSMIAGCALHFNRHALPSGLVSAGEMLVWIIASFGQYMRASVSRNPVEFSRFLAGWSSVMRMMATTFSGMGFELACVFALCDAMMQNLTQALFGPMGSEFASLQWSIVSVGIALGTSWMVGFVSRQTFVLRFRLYSQVMKGANAARSQHGMLDQSPATVAFVGPGYATVRPDHEHESSRAQSQTGKEQSEAPEVRTALRIDVHQAPSIVVSTAGMQRLLSGLRSAALKYGIPWSSVSSERFPKERGYGSMMPVDEGAQGQVPMLEFSGCQLLELLGICPQDRALALWALRCVPERSQTVFRQAALRLCQSLPHYSLPLSMGIKKQPCFSFGHEGEQIEQEAREQDYSGYPYNQATKMGPGDVRMRRFGRGSSTATSVRTRASEVSQHHRGTFRARTGHESSYDRAMVRGAPAPLPHVSDPVHASQADVEVSVTSNGDSRFGDIDNAPTVARAEGVFLVDWSNPSGTGGEGAQPAASHQGATTTTPNQELQSYACTDVCTWRRIALHCDAFFGCNVCCCLGLFPSAWGGQTSRWIGGSSDPIQQLSEALAQLFYVSRAAASVGAVLELRPLDDVRAAMAPWDLLQQVSPFGRNRSAPIAGQGQQTDGGTGQGGDKDRSEPRPPGYRLARHRRGPIPGESSSAAVQRSFGRTPAKPALPGQLQSGQFLTIVESTASSGHPSHDSKSGSSSVAGGRPGRQAAPLVAVGGELLVAADSTGQRDRRVQPAGAAGARQSTAARSASHMFSGGSLRVATGPEAATESTHSKESRYLHSRSSGDGDLYEEDQVRPAGGIASGQEHRSGKGKVLEDPPPTGQTTAKESRALRLQHLGGQSWDGDRSQRESSASEDESFQHAPCFTPVVQSPADNTLAEDATVASRMRLVHPASWQGIASARALVGKARELGPQSVEVRRTGSPSSGAGQLDTGGSRFRGRSIDIEDSTPQFDFKAPPEHWRSSDGEGGPFQSDRELPQAQAQEMVELKEKFRGLLSTLNTTEPEGQHRYRQPIRAMRRTYRASQSPHGRALPLRPETGRLRLRGSEDSSSAPTSRLWGTGRGRGFEDAGGAGLKAEPRIGSSGMVSGSEIGAEGRRAGWPILRATDDERHVVLRVGLGATVVAEVYLMARRHEGGAVVSLTLMS